MCHVLIKSEKVFKTPQEKKEFQSKMRLEVLKTVKNPIILFVFTGTKNAEKTERRYLKEHPKAIAWQTGLKVKVTN